MKVLKVVLIVFGVLVVLVTGGAIIFLKTFNVNSYLPQVTQQVSRSIGRDLKIAGAELGFSLARGIRLQVRDITLADDPVFSDKPFFSVNRIEIGVNLGSLFLDRKFEMTGIVIDSPKVSVIRSKDGAINVQSMGGKASPNGSENPAVAIPAFLVKDIRVVNGCFTYIDQGSSPTLTLTMERVDVHAGSFSLVDPFMVSLKAALFSAEQNVTVDVRVASDLLKRSVHLSGLRAEVDLSLIDPARLEGQVQALRPFAFKRTAGLFRIDIPEVEAGAKGLEAFKAQALLENGLVLSGLIPLPVENIMFTADITERQIDIKTLTMSFADGVLRGNALVVDYNYMPVVAGAVKAAGVNISKIAAAFNAPLGARGILSGDGNLKFSGTSSEDIFSSFAGEIRADVKDAVIENMDLLSAGLGKIPLLPGLVDSLMPEFSKVTQEDIRQGSMRFETVHAQGRFVRGIFQLDAADATNQDFAVHALGAVDLVSGLDIKVDLRLTPELSERLILRAKALAGLKDEDGRIYFPLDVRGALGQPRVAADLEYLAKKMIVAQGGDQLQQILGTPDAAQAVDAIFDLFKKK